mmetsp:Transcript_77477/g.122034  ORF Transcript_77477/g.122034 Transcript_77477/m.122034 type:complete len:215 (-) Transcript_77477:265-909(-)
MFLQLLLLLSKLACPWCLNLVDLALRPPASGKAQDLSQPCGPSTYLPQIILELSASTANLVQHGLLHLLPLKLSPHGRQGRPGLQHHAEMPLHFRSHTFALFSQCLFTGFRFLPREPSFLQCFATFLLKSLRMTATCVFGLVFTSCDFVLQLRHVGAQFLVQLSHLGQELPCQVLLAFTTQRHLAAQRLCQPLLLLFSSICLQRGAFHGDLQLP